jgi:hypothetical protein
MVKLPRAAFRRTTTGTSGRLLTTRYPWVFPFRFEDAKISCPFVIAFGCPDGPPLTSGDSLSQASVPRTVQSHSNQNSNKVCSSKVWYSKRDLAPVRYCEPTWVLPSFYKGPSVGHSGFATAAVHVLEPGRYWRGKGWNRVGQEDDSPVQFPGTEYDLSNTSQFDAIPDLEDKLKFLESYGLGDSQLEQMRKRHPSSVKNTILKLSVKKLIEVATFLEEEAGVEKKDFANLLFANPYIAGSRVDECLRPKVVLQGPRFEQSASMAYFLG